MFLVRKTLLTFTHWKLHLHGASPASTVLSRINHIHDTRRDTLSHNCHLSYLNSFLLPLLLSCVRVRDFGVGEWSVQNRIVSLEGVLKHVAWRKEK